MKSAPIWVLDTNVLVSALWSERGAPAQVWRACQDGRFILGYDPVILSEYRDVLYRPELEFPLVAVADMIAVIPGYGIVLPTPPIVPGVLGLPDRDDEAFLAAALVSPDRVLIPGNTRHYPPRHRRGVEVLNPREALSRLE